MDKGAVSVETSTKVSSGKREMSSVSGSAKKAPEPRMVRGTKGLTLLTASDFYLFTSITTT